MTPISARCMQGIQVLDHDETEAKLSRVLTSSIRQVYLK